MNHRKSLLDWAPGELTEWMDSRKHPGYRARQILDWIVNKQTLSFARMSDLPKTLRDDLERSFSISTLLLEFSVEAKDGTRKFLWKLQDGIHVESVLIVHPDHHTLCISSQAGCALGCRFCATASLGILRNLTTSEILSQIMEMLHLLGSSNRVNIVFMGMGEPLLNLENVARSVQFLTSEEGMGWAKQRITVSTAGIAPEIRRLHALAPGVRLAVSLNAPDDKTRNPLMPINKVYPLRILMQALSEFPLPSRQHQITIEYIMIRNLNDTPEHAKKLTRLLSKDRYKINLIPFNSSSGSRYHPSDESVMLEFQKHLLDAGFLVRIRRSAGREIAAACGQLAANQAEHAR